MRQIPRRGRLGSGGGKVGGDCGDPCCDLVPLRLVDLEHPFLHLQVVPHPPFAGVGRLADEDGGRAGGDRHDRRVLLHAHHSRRPGVNAARLGRQPVPVEITHARLHVLRQLVEQQRLEQRHGVGHLRRQQHAHLRRPHPRRDRIAQLRVIDLGELLVDLDPLRVGLARFGMNLPVRRPAQPRNGAEKLARLHVVLLEQRVGGCFVAKVDREGGVGAERDLRTSNAGRFQRALGIGVAQIDELRTGQQIAIAGDLTVVHGDSADAVRLARLLRQQQFLHADDARAGAVQEEIAVGQRGLLLGGGLGDLELGESRFQQRLDAAIHTARPERHLGVGAVLLQ